MPRFASNKYAKGISDRSGREYPLKTMILEKIEIDEESLDYISQNA